MAQCPTEGSQPHPGVPTVSPVSPSPTRAPLRGLWVRCALGTSTQAGDNALGVAAPSPSVSCPLCPIPVLILSPLSHPFPSVPSLIPPVPSLSLSCPPVRLSSTGPRLTQGLWSSLVLSPSLPCPVLRPPSSPVPSVPPVPLPVPSVPSDPPCPALPLPPPPSCPFCPLQSPLSHPLPPVPSVPSDPPCPIPSVPSPPSCPLRSPSSCSPAPIPSLPSHSVPIPSHLSPSLPQDTAHTGTFGALPSPSIPPGHAGGGPSSPRGHRQR